MSESFDCVACGKCCFGQRDYVQVYAEDADRLGPERVAKYVGAPMGELDVGLHRSPQPIRYMRMVDGHCAALQISQSGRRFTCAVYEDRPLLCRVLEAGSPSCLEARGSSVTT